MTINELIIFARATGCSDIHLTPGQPPYFRKIGILEKANMEFTPEEMTELILSIMNENQRKAFDSGNDVDFSYETSDACRQRVNVYRERKKICCAIRLLNNSIPTVEELNLPPVLNELALKNRGLILVTGPTGSGKSTTLASMLNYINQNRQSHILTIEDPIEYEHSNIKSLIHQREIGDDVKSFADALRAALREDPDVILVGEMRDYETISAALTAAETGHLVFSTLHTIGAANTIDRIIDAFPPEAQNQVRTQLSTTLQGIITQQLLPNTTNTGRVPSLEILVGTDAIRNLIRDNKCHQIASVMEMGAKDGMRTSAQDLARLFKENKITKETAFARCPNKMDLEQYIPL